MANPDWYRDAIIYSIDVKTFNDSDGDGWGDFRGLIDRLGYIEQLGVDCLWLRPFYPSPIQDNGYDVSDYYAVDPKLGTLGDVTDLVERAHERGIRVIIDTVFNHTSDQHPWFKRAREDPYSDYHDYYLWTSDVENAQKRGNIFPDYEDGVWSYDEVAEKHYFHQFYSFQPDLNVANPDVQEEIFDVLEFWLDLGVDGFRIDAAHPMTMPKGHDGTKLDDPIGLFEEMKARVHEKNEEAILLAEADDQPDELAYYFGGGDSFDLMFNFVLNSHLVYGVGVKDTWPLHRAMEVLPDVSDVGHWANFLRNHDEWNLLKLPWEAMDHGREFFGPEDGSSWIFGRGHRLRLADLYAGDHDRIALAHSLMLAMPGTSVLLAGDEIGMGANLDLPEREAVRTPMQWSNNRNGGFSTADADELVNPVTADGEFGYRWVNVADQIVDPTSLLRRIERLVDARRLCSEIGTGDIEMRDVPPKEVWVHRLTKGSTVLLTAHNTADERREVTVDFEPPAAAATRIVGPGEYSVEDGRCTFTLDACEYAWIRGDRRGQRVPLGRP
jgi:maltose alpha-D-glucosyltransferase/alpha-amylase